MPTTLPPTVHERLARCGERVFVDGLVLGATVELHIAGAVLTTTASGGGHSFVVPPLTAGASVRARQDAGAGFSSFSPTVVVDNVLVPPEAAPSLPEEIGACSECVFVTHATPGAGLELRIGADIVGAGTANRRGEACVGVNIRGEPGALLRARQVVCGVPGPDASRQLAKQSALPRPVIGDPIFGCQSRVPVSQARPGARLTFETDGGDDLGSLCSCWRTVNVRVIRPLAVGELVCTRSLYSGQTCEDMGPWSEFQLVVPPDERIKPEVLEALIEGDQTIRVANQIAGASLLIRIAPAAGQVSEEFGPRPTSDEEIEVGLGAPLVAGNIVTVVQTLCGVSVESDPVTVQPRPPVILAPVLVPPLSACGQAVQLSNLHPGALVRVFMDGIGIGWGWAGLQNSITVGVEPLAAGGKVTAIQLVGGTPGPVSDAVVVGRGVLARPRLLGPLALGDQSVWVSGVTPGAHVAILSGGSVIGEADAAEPIVRVPISMLLGAVQVGATPRVRLCERTLTGPGLSAIRSPCDPLLDVEVTETTLDFGSFDVPTVPDGGGFTLSPLRGQLYAPEKPRRDRSPLVVIAHGWHTGFDPSTGDPVESFKGYGYLAHHLVRWGMLVFSIDLQGVNFLSGSPEVQQFARAEILLHAITELLSFSVAANLIDSNRIGLVGHSMGAEAVVVTQAVNVAEARGFGIRGVVSIAPTRHHPEVVMPAGRYLQLLGSLDQLTTFIPGNDSPGPHGGLRFYDRAERDKTLFWLYGMRHNPFNSLWVAAGDFGEQSIADVALPEAEHQRAAKCLINAFFQEALFNRQEYRGYMQGAVFPQSLRHLEIHTSYSRQPREVLDTFGDADPQAGLSVETPLDKTINARNQAAAASGAALGTWEDEQHTTISGSPHSTAGVRLSWEGPSAEYRSETGGIAGALDDVIALRLAQFFRDTTLNPVALPADLFVILSDGTEEALVRLGAVAQIPYPDATGLEQSVMRTVRLPLDAFQAANPALNLSDLQSVTLRFLARPTGHLLGDDFELSP